MTSNKGLTCLRKGCDRPAKAKGLCNNHYNVAFQVRKRRKREQGSLEMRFGRNVGKSPAIKDPEGIRLYAYESRRWQEAQTWIADALRRFGQGQTLWAMPAWGDGARGLERDTEAETLIDWYTEHHPKNFQPWRKSDWRIRPTENEQKFRNLVRDTCRRTAATIANGLRFELAKARDVVVPVITVDPELQKLIDELLES